MRRPAGTGFCCPMISFTLETALDVSETGGVFFTSWMLVFTSGTVVVAIRISLALKYLNYSRGPQVAGRVTDHGPGYQPPPRLWVAGPPPTVSPPPPFQRGLYAFLWPFPPVRGLRPRPPPPRGGE